MKYKDIIRIGLAKGIIPTDEEYEKMKLSNRKKLEKIEAYLSKL